MQVLQLKIEYTMSDILVNILHEHEWNIWNSNVRTFIKAVGWFFYQFSASPVFRVLVTIDIQ